MDTSDAVPLIRDDNDGTISFRFFESDNTPLEYQMFMNLFPNEWYSETCSTYYVTVYVPYFDSFRRVKCYEFGEGILDIGIDRCRVNNLPQSDFYKFKFEVSSVF